MSEDLKHILVIKTGALGDVIRTQYFAEPMFKSGRRLWWYTSSLAADLISHNPFIDRVVTTPAELHDQIFDTVYSLDDEAECIDVASSLATERIEGLFYSGGHIKYTEGTSVWNDMGILSRFGKEQADSLKKLNQRSHAAIFADIFGVTTENVVPKLYYPIEKLIQARQWLGQSCRKRGPVVLINFSAGKRWKSKALPIAHAAGFFARVGDIAKNADVQYVVAYDAASRDYVDELRQQLGDSVDVLFINTAADVHLLSSLVKLSSLVVTTDSLVMHLAVAQGVRTIAIFISTSSAEIDDFGVLEKVVANGPDVCSYKPIVSADTSIDVDELAKVFKERLSTFLIR